MIVTAFGTEMGVLALYALLVILVMLLSVLAAMPQVGLVYLMGNRDRRRPVDGFAARLDRAQANCLTGLILFAPAVLIVAQLDLAGGPGVLFAQIFLLARLAYVATYAAGIPVLRTLAWTVALLANVAIYLLPFASGPLTA